MDQLLISNVNIKRKTYQRFSEAVHLDAEVEAVCEIAGVGRRTACFDG
jgi:hypothetical protein